jgi:2-haloalkanoic acid dehalogenase type II
MQLTDFDTLTFDCYGTLIDWESGMMAALAPLVARSGRALPRDQVLAAHARHEAAQQRWTPAKRYSELLAVVFKRLAEEWGVAASWEEALAYGRSIADWPAFPDTPEALALLKRHYRLVILSNVDNASFAHSAGKLGVALDAIYTAEDIGSYKPSLRNFEYMLEKLERLGVRRARILHTAESLFHDHEPVQRLGLARCWIHRRHAQGGFGATLRPASEPKVDFRFTSLAELAEAVRQERGG